MAVIENKWIKKDKPKPKAEPKEKAGPKHVPTITKSNMSRTLRGVRK